jgi:hypothetical protein
VCSAARNDHAEGHGARPPWDRWRFGCRSSRHPSGLDTVSRNAFRVSRRESTSSRSHVRTCIGKLLRRRPEGIWASDMRRTPPQAARDAIVVLCGLMSTTGRRHAAVERSRPMTCRRPARQRSTAHVQRSGRFDRAPRQPVLDPGTTACRARSLPDEQRCVTYTVRTLRAGSSGAIYRGDGLSLGVFAAIRGRGETMMPSYDGARAAPGN